MESVITAQNWSAGPNSSVLANIHESKINIAIFKREINALQEELDKVIKRGIALSITGDANAVSNSLDGSKDLTHCPLLKQDIKDLLHLFSEVSQSRTFRLFLATIENDMCRKFHTDVNDLRMLCTYKGPGTLWLAEGHMDHEEVGNGDEETFIHPDRIRQAETGDVVILKGAIYPREGTQAILHRSPSIEESKEKRILLRFDTEQFASF